MRLPPEPPRILVLDVDGTLLDSRQRLTDATRRAVAAVRGAGVDVILATGRIPSAIAGLCRELELEGEQVCMHGAVVARPLTGEIIESRPLRREEVRSQLDFARELGVQAIVAGLAGFRATELRPGTEHLFLEFDEPLPDVVDEARLAEEPALKTYLVTGEDRYQEVLASARLRFGERFTITSPDHRSVELLAAGVSKLEGVRKVAARRGLGPATFAAVGDGPNDVPLLEAAAISAAMGQAPAEVRAVASFVTESNDQDGLARALERIYTPAPARPAAVPG